jgi:hypothetical protein
VLDRNGDPLAFATARQQQVVEHITARQDGPAARQGGGCYAEPPLKDGTIEIRRHGHHLGFVLPDGTRV